MRRRIVTLCWGLLFGAVNFRGLFDRHNANKKRGSLEVVVDNSSGVCVSISVSNITKEVFYISGRICIHPHTFIDRITTSSTSIVSVIFSCILFSKLIFAKLGELFDQKTCWKKLSCKLFLVSDNLVLKINSLLIYIFVSLAIKINLGPVDDYVLLLYSFHDN